MLAAVVGTCEMLVPYLGENDRPGGVVSGHLYMHAADVAFWLAVKTLRGVTQEYVTSSMTSAFLGSGPGTRIHLHCACNQERSAADLWRGGMPGGRANAHAPHAHVRERGLSASRATQEPPSAKGNAEHDHDGPYPEPLHVTGHEAARDEPKTLPGKHRAGEQDQDPYHANACSHGLGYQGGLPDSAEDHRFFLGVLQERLHPMLLAEA